MTPARRAEWSAAREERLTELHAQVAAGVVALVDADGWRAMLTTARRLHRYILGNLLLISARRPAATQVVVGTYVTCRGRWEIDAESITYVVTGAAGTRHQCLHGRLRRGVGEGPPRTGPRHRRHRPALRRGTVLDQLDTVADPRGGGRGRGLSSWDLVSPHLR